MNTAESLKNSVQLDKKYQEDEFSIKQEEYILNDVVLTKVKSSDNYILPTYKPESNEDIKEELLVSSDSETHKDGNDLLEISKTQIQDNIELEDANSLQDFELVQIFDDDYLPEDDYTPQEKLELKNQKYGHDSQDVDYKCGICQKVSTGKYSLHRHVKRMHPNAKALKCGHCDELFSNLILLSRHVRVSHFEVLPKKHVCGFCMEDFKEPARLEVHLKIHTGDRPYSCSLCEKNFKKSDALQYHIRTHLKPKLNRSANQEMDNIVSKCGVCQMKFMCLSDLAKHANELHSNDKPYECQHCGEFCSNTLDLTSHFKKAHNEIAKKHVCSTCLKFFIRISDMKRHYKTVHLGKRYPCSLCDKTFTRSDAVKFHQKIHHPIEDSKSCDDKDFLKKKYFCKFCFKKYNNFYSLKRHLSRHIAEQPYSCSLCKKMFKQRKDLKKHNNLYIWNVLKRCRNIIQRCQYPEW